MQILIPLILCIESKLINIDKIIKCLNTAEKCQFSVFSTHWPSPKWHIWCVIVLLRWLLHACEVHETAKCPICNFETTKLPLLKPQCTLLQAPQQTTILQYMKDYNTKCGLRRRPQVLMVAFGTGPKVSLQELRNMLMWQDKITSVLTAHWNLIQVFH